MVDIGTVITIVIFIAIVIAIGFYRDRLKDILWELGINFGISLLLVMGFVNLFVIPTGYYIWIFLLAFIGITVTHTLIAPTPQKKMQKY